MRIQAVEEMKAAKCEAEAGNYAAARIRLEGSTKRMKANRNLKAAYVADMVGDMEEATRGLGSSSAYESAGRHTVTHMTMSHAYQRAMLSVVPEGSVTPSSMSKYSTWKKKARAAQYHSGTIKEQASK